MPDDENPLIVPAQRQVAEETAGTGDRLSPAFPARIRLLQVLTPPTVHLGRGHPIALAVIALAQPPVIQHRNAASMKGYGYRLASTPQVGAEHGRYAVIAASAPKILCLYPSRR